MNKSSILHDFRSDTVTQPSKGMRAAMMDAPLGDDVFGEDPTVNRLQDVLTERLGKEAGLFMPSGTQSNLVALMAHCGRGDEFIAGQSAHLYHWEAGGSAVLGSIQPQPITNQPDGTLLLDDIKNAIKADDIHLAVTKMLALENTISGKILPPDYVRAATRLAHEYNLTCHLDGARAFNAAVGSGVDIATITECFDSVSICFSKGLGTPAGSMLLGNKEFITRAHRLRKMLGGGMRQIGILAAAALYALDNNIDRLADDHANAEILAKGLANYDALTVISSDTNIVLIDAEKSLITSLITHLNKNGIGAGQIYGKLRLVTHMDVNKASITKTLKAVDTFFSKP